MSHINRHKRRRYGPCKPELELTEAEKEILLKGCIMEKDESDAMAKVIFESSPLRELSKEKKWR